VNESAFVQLCAYLDELAKLTSEIYRKVDAMESVVKGLELTREFHRMREGKSDAGERLASLAEHVAGLRESLLLPASDRPTLPERPEPPNLSWMDED
jgi:hypothetical protein